MTSLLETPGALVPPARSDRARTGLWPSFAIASLAILASVTGIFVDRIYADETANWGAQAVGQDIANLVAFPLLLVSGWLSRKGSLRAYICWLGALVYSVYTFVIYAFAIHFGPLFLVYVAVMGLSAFALASGLLPVALGHVRARFVGRPPVQVTSALLVGIGASFSVLWLTEIIPAVLGGTRPQSLSDVGLVTNPVHILDLSILLPASIFTGIALRQGREWSLLIAPILLVGMILIGVGILAAMMTLVVHGVEVPLGPAAMIAAMTLVQVLVVIRFTSAIERSV